MGGKFVSAAGTWLDNPITVLRATDGTGNQTSALLKLSAPHFNATQRTLTFRVRPAMRPHYACATPQQLGQDEWDLG